MMVKGKAGVLLLFLLMGLVGMAQSAEDGADQPKDAKVKAKPTECPREKLGRVFLVLGYKKNASRDLVTVVHKMSERIGNKLGCFSCKTTLDEDIADPLERGFMLKVMITKKKELERTYKYRDRGGNYITTVTSTWYDGSYRLYESRNGKWKRVASGSLQLTHYDSENAQLAALIYDELLPVRVRKVNANSDGSCKVYAKIKNKSEFDFYGIDLRAPFANNASAVPKENISGYSGLDKLDKGDKKSFSFEAVKLLPFKYGSKTMNATLEWKKGYVSCVRSFELAKDEEEEKQ